MICYQSFGLRSLRTTVEGIESFLNGLWFAINPSDYVLCEQPTIFYWALNRSCDLLSILRITFFANNDDFGGQNITWVVICYQSFGLRSLRTTTISSRYYCKLLWFAINPSDYVLCEQQQGVLNRAAMCCDLLSILRITFFANNISVTLVIWI